MQENKKIIWVHLKNKQETKGQKNKNTYVKLKEEKRTSWRWQRKESKRRKRHKTMKKRFPQSQLCRSSRIMASNSPTLDTNFSSHPFLFLFHRKKKWNFFNQLISFIAIIVQMPNNVRSVACIDCHVNESDEGLKLNRCVIRKPGFFWSFFIFLPHFLKIFLKNMQRQPRQESQLLKLCDWPSIFRLICFIFFLYGKKIEDKMVRS